MKQKGRIPMQKTLILFTAMFLAISFSVFAGLETVKGRATIDYATFEVTVIDAIPTTHKAKVDDSTIYVGADSISDFHNREVTLVIHYTDQYNPAGTPPSNTNRAVKIILHEPDNRWVEKTKVDFFGGMEFSEENDDFSTPFRFVMLNVEHRLRQNETYLSDPKWDLFWYSHFTLTTLKVVKAKDKVNGDPLPMEAVSVDKLKLDFDAEKIFRFRLGIGGFRYFSEDYFKIGPVVFLGADTGRETVITDVDALQKEVTLDESRDLIFKSFVGLRGETVKGLYRGGYIMLGVGHSENYDGAQNMRDKVDSELTSDDLDFYEDDESIKRSSKSVRYKIEGYIPIWPELLSSVNKKINLGLMFSVDADGGSGDDETKIMTLFRYKMK
jgi:hypothetical protein